MRTSFVKYVLKYLDLALRVERIEVVVNCHFERSWLEMMDGRSWLKVMVSV